MKKLIILLLCSLTLTIYSAPIKTDSIIKTANTLASGGKLVYDDLKSGVKELKHDAEEILYWSVSRADTVLGKGINKLSKTAEHTYTVLKQQQLVKSIHHTIYWILGICMSYVFFRLLSKYIKSDSTSDSETGRLIIIGLGTAILWIYNGFNFMELWTGYINPEYGAIMEIMDYLR